jgi:hypothetical protein
MTDVEEAYGVSASLMFVEHAGVLHGELPAPEIN